MVRSDAVLAAGIADYRRPWAGCARSATAECSWATIPTPPKMNCPRANAEWLSAKRCTYEHSSWAGLIHATLPSVYYPHLPHFRMHAIALPECARLEWTRNSADSRRGRTATRCRWTSAARSRCANKMTLTILAYGCSWFARWNCARSLMCWGILVYVPVLRQ